MSHVHIAVANIYSSRGPWLRPSAATEMRTRGIRPVDCDACTTQFRCTRCGTEWSVLAFSDGRMPHLWWKCPNECN
jgi:hypothetical protein